MDPTYELAAAVIARLRSSPALTAFVGTKIYDRVPENQDGTLNVTSPYISLGPSDAVSDDADCVDGLVVTFQVDAWSWGIGEAFSRAEVSKIADAVRRALMGQDITLAENAVVTLGHRVTRIMRASDGITNHAAITFEAFVETP